MCDWTCIRGLIARARIRKDSYLSPIGYFVLRGIALRQETYIINVLFLRVDCEGSHSSHDAASKITVVGAIQTTGKGINEKLILRISKGPDCVQMVHSLRITPQSNLIVNQP